jgi:hypothetical protein
MVHFTSAVSAPIFRSGANYNGSPPPLGIPVLREWVLKNLATELAAMPDAIIIPLGKTACEAVSLVAAQGSIDARRCLAGFPHPSGANGHRKHLIASTEPAEIEHLYLDGRLPFCAPCRRRRYFGRADYRAC